MTTYAIDDAEYIRRRLEEIEAEKQLALTGSSLPEKQEVPSVESVYGDYAMGWRTTSSYVLASACDVQCTADEFAEWSAALTAQDMLC